MKAPKKIWMSEDTLWEAYKLQHEDDIHYIRADIVDELVEALTGFVAISRMKGAIAEEDINPESPLGKGIAALAKLEKKND